MNTREGEIARWKISEVEKVIVGGYCRGGFRTSRENRKSFVLKIDLLLNKRSGFWRLSLLVIVFEPYKVLWYMQIEWD